MTIAQFQELIERIYFEKDNVRGKEGTFVWLVEEVGELAKAVARPEKVKDGNLEEEFADVLAWLTSLASLCGVDLQAAAELKYARGCPKCGETPCGC